MLEMGNKAVNKVKRKKYTKSFKLRYMFAAKMQALKLAKKTERALAKMKAEAIDIKEEPLQDNYDSYLFEEIKHEIDPLIVKQIKLESPVREKLDFICTVCGLDYAFDDHLERHVFLVHRPLALEVIAAAEIYCSKCCKWYAKECDFESHWPCFAVQGQCPICNVISPTKYHFLVHDLTWINQKSYQCNLCDINTTMFPLSQINIHMQLVHKKKGIYECNQCQMIFPVKTSLTQHVYKEHDGIFYKLNSDLADIQSSEISITDNTIQNGIDSPLIVNKSNESTYTRQSINQAPSKNDDSIITENLPVFVPKLSINPNIFICNQIRDTPAIPVVEPVAETEETERSDDAVPCQNVKIYWDLETKANQLIPRRNTIESEIIKLNKSKKPITYKSVKFKTNHAKTVNLQPDTPNSDQTLPIIPTTDSIVTNTAIPSSSKTNHNNNDKTTDCLLKTNPDKSVLHLNVSITDKSVEEPSTVEQSVANRCVLVDKSIIEDLNPDDAEMHQSSVDECLVPNNSKAIDLPPYSIENISENAQTLEDGWKMPYRIERPISPSPAPVFIHHKLPEETPKRDKNMRTPAQIRKFCKIVICDICDMDFLTFGDRRAHCVLVHRPWAFGIKDGVYCCKCRKWYKDEFLFQRHAPCYVFAVKKRCPICYVEKPTMDHFKLHNVVYYPFDSAYCCKLCESNPAFFRLEQLNTHRQETHGKNGVFECLMCNSTFENIKITKDHILDVHQKQGVVTGVNLKTTSVPLRLYNCKICSKTFFEKRLFDKHHQVHEGALCSVCGQSFKSKGQMFEHLNKHTKQQIFECNECDSTFAMRKYLTQHAKIHKVKKNFICDVCDQPFTQQTSLIYHMAAHTQENIFKCTICDIKFDLQSKLTSHMQIHIADGTNPHVCKICGKNFSHKCNLLVHMRTHPDNKKDCANDTKTAVEDTGTNESSEEDMVLGESESSEEDANNMEDT